MEERSGSIPGNFLPRDWIAVLILGALTVFVYFSSLGAALDVRQDDHRIVFFSGAAPLHDQVLTAEHGVTGPIRPTVTWHLESDAEGGRFRPITQVLEVLLPRMLGTNAFQWHLLVLLLAVVTSTTLFLIGRRLGGTWVEGAALALLLVLAPDPGPAKVWYMMSVKAESFGTLFILFSLLASIRAAHPSSRLRDEILPLALIAAAMLTKEPFALLLPALLAVRLGLPRWLGYSTGWRDIPRLGYIVAAYLALGALYAAEIVMLIATAPPTSYGTQSLRDPAMFGKGLRITLGNLPLQAMWFVPVLLAAATLVRRRGAGHAMRTFSIPLALTVTWIAPQILLYSLRGGMWDHYWLPCSMALAALNVWSLRVLRLEGSRAAYALALVVLAVWSLNGVRTNIPTVQNYVQRTLMRKDVVEALAKRIPPNGKVVVVADNAVYSEYASSWVFFAGDAGRPHSTYLLYNIDEPRTGAFTRTLFFPHAPTLDQLDSCSVDAIVFLGKPADNDQAWARWYRKDCFKSESFARPQEYFSIRKFGLTREAVELEVAFRKGLP